jgi:hypothetical protein
MIHRRIGHLADFDIGQVANLSPEGNAFAYFRLYSE